MNHENKVILINHLVFDTGDGLSSASFLSGLLFGENRDCL